MGHIKLWDSILDCPKVHGLSDRAFRVWVKALVTALRNGGRHGELPPMETLEFRMRMSATAIESALDELHARGLIDRCHGNHIGGIPWKIHDWDDWQTPRDRTAASRQKRWREKQALRNALRNGVSHAQNHGVEELKEEYNPPTPLSGGGEAVIATEPRTENIASPAASPPSQPTVAPGPGPGPGPGPRAPEIDALAAKLEQLRPLEGWPRWVSDMAAMYESSWIEPAVQAAMGQDKLTKRYVHGILRRWAAEGLPGEIRGRLAESGRPKSAPAAPAAPRLWKKGDPLP